MDKELHSWLKQFINFGSVISVDKVSLNRVVLDLFVSDTCNLRCRHCYFGTTKTQKERLSSDDWKRVIDVFRAHGVNHFHFSGRESSLDQRILNIVSYIKTNPQSYTGIVSNGTGDYSFYKKAFENGLDYLEFSLDGIKDTHNYIRRFDVYYHVIDNLIRLSDYSNQIDITTCLNKNSLNEYLSLIDTVSKLGITKFFATPFMVVGNGKDLSNFTISPKDFSDLIEKTVEFLKENEGRHLSIRYCIPHEYTFQMISEGEFFKQEILGYLNGVSNLVYRIKGNALQLSLNLFDIDFLNMISITADGEVLPCSDYIGYDNYWHYSIGNVKTDSIESIMHNRIKCINNTINSIKNG